MPRLCVRRTPKRRYLIWFLGNGLQILDKFPALLIGQKWTDDAISTWAILEGVAGIRISAQSCIHQERPGLSTSIKSDFHRIELSPEVELFRSLFGRDQHLVEIWH